MKNKSSDSIDSMIAMVLLMVIAMPIFGIYLCTHQNSKEDDKFIGGVLIVLGIIIWLVLGLVG